MEIKSYDPYHIGIKINSQLPILHFREKILSNLRSAGLNTDNLEEHTSNVPSENEVIALDGKIRIEFNYKLNAVNTEGDDPIKTTNTFKKLLKVIEQTDLEMKGISTSIDVVTNVFVKTDSTPAELINKSIKCDLAPWKEINQDVEILNGIKIDLIDEKFGKESLRIIIGPSSLNPTTQLALTIRYLHIETQPIITFGEKLEERVMKFLNSLGG